MRSDEMTTGTVTEQQVLEELRGLEPGRWLEVLDFIGYLKHCANLDRAQPSPRELTARALLQSELVGLWADRDDIGDSLAFARQLRQQAEHRRRTTDDTG
jgi:hypothetical protein